MKFLVAIFLLSIAGQTLSLPVNGQHKPNAVVVRQAKSSNPPKAAATGGATKGNGGGGAGTGTGAAAPKGSTAPKATPAPSNNGGEAAGGKEPAGKEPGAKEPGGAGTGAGTGGGNATGGTGGAMPSAADVEQAATNFAKDANTVSACFNQLAIETDPVTIKSLAQRAFDAETDEDAQRAVLAAGAGSAGTSSNNKIVTSTPTVLDGLKRIVNDPTPEVARSQVGVMATERNSQILPSITQLSNAALVNTKSQQRQQDFVPTVQA